MIDGLGKFMAAASSGTSLSTDRGRAIREQHRRHTCPIRIPLTLLTEIVDAA
jgi:hypothetical protein